MTNIPTYKHGVIFTFHRNKKKTKISDFPQSSRTSKHMFYLQTYYLYIRERKSSLEKSHISQLKTLQTQKMCFKERCENGLDPFHLQSKTSSKNMRSFVFYSTQASSSVWHFRLGYPTSSIFSNLFSNKCLPISDSQSHSKSNFVILVHLEKAKNYHQFSQIQHQIFHNSYILLYGLLHIYPIVVTSIV